MATNTPPPDHNGGVKVYDQPKRGLSPALIIPLLLALGVLAYFLTRPRQAEPVGGNSGAMRTMERSNGSGESGTMGSGATGSGATGGTGMGTGGSATGGSTATGSGATANPPGPAAAGGR